MKRFVLLFSLLSLYYGQAFSQSADSSKHELRFTNSQLYTPAALLLSGLLSNGHSQESVKHEVAEERNEYIPRFKTKLDDYLQFSPIAVAYGLDALGFHSKTDIMNRSVILVKGELLAIGSATVLKRVTHELRPDGSAYTSFPSGHTTQAFAAATFLSEEYKDRYRWMPYVSYTAASSVGLLRMANNRHYISDVLVGAGIGFLSMKVAYWTHQYKWGKIKQNRQVIF